MAPAALALPDVVKGRLGTEREEDGQARQIADRDCRKIAVIYKIRCSDRGDHNYILRISSVLRQPLFLKWLFPGKL